MQRSPTATRLSRRSIPIRHRPRKSPIRGWRLAGKNQDLTAGTKDVIALREHRPFHDPESRTSELEGQAELARLGGSRRG
jgi:hypothetical protein